MLHKLMSGGGLRRLMIYDADKGGGASAGGGDGKAGGSAGGAPAGARAPGAAAAAAGTAADPGGTGGSGGGAAAGAAGNAGAATLAGTGADPARVAVAAPAKFPDSWREQLFSYDKIALTEVRRYGGDVPRVPGAAGQDLPKAS
jgi:hypothetical protein